MHSGEFLAQDEDDCNDALEHLAFTSEEWADNSQPKELVTTASLNQVTQELVEKVMNTLRDSVKPSSVHDPDTVSEAGEYTACIHCHKLDHTEETCTVYSFDHQSAPPNRPYQNYSNQGTDRRVFSLSNYSLLTHVICKQYL